jgi:hypothetical protein
VALTNVLGRAVGAFFYCLSKYSEQINRTKAAKDIFFLLDSAFNFSYNAVGILMFKALSFMFAPPLYYNNTTMFIVCQEVFQNILLFFFIFKKI